MRRLAWVLAIGGSVLFATRVQSPASPPVPAAPGTADLAASVEQAAPAVAQVNEEVSRLRERLSQPVRPPAPARNPFQFGRRTEPRPAPSAAVETPAPDPVEPEVILPRLVAIVADDSPEDTVVRTAVLARPGSDEFLFLKTGELLDGLKVAAIERDAVVLSDPASGRTHRLSLN